MQSLAMKYGDRGYQTFCFPCNQFKGQEPGTHEQIQQFITGGWPDLNAQLFEKIDVNGDDTSLVYVYLKRVFPGDVAWNFKSTFIIGRDGIPCARIDGFGAWEEIEQRIKEELDKK
mmetsp:Transcript_6517/g.10318  ORF Transcript_6517/g.10318 Transcript_6517/m.10318 type:complete len:116 (+) Transcript_6517:142-489(+)|eukprot:CAMPEP_0202690504 /NCGR_PEP_ID=MMETSP1385-20130828/5462_1 /ASSEMBLY_ACC=CAM_ASM_000861 /TAXON_ID=933848 /ORGANISM="Elphidium margaritaceum" /LENGTH=115 /DNA_ID=CAMNT_0049345771 /DNA_START=249 /DNA_END=596 /DNA_ORIENTATION=-